QQSKTLLDLLPIGVWIGNYDCSEIHGNPAAYKIFGFPEGINASITSSTPQVPSGIRIRVDGKEVDPNDAPMQTVARTGKSWKNFEHEVIHQDGTIKTIYGSAVPLLDENGKVRQIIAAYADYSEKKKLEAALKWQNDSNRILAEVLQGLLSEDDPRQIASKLFTSVSSFLEVDAIFNYAVNETGDGLRLYSYAGISEQAAMEIEYIQFGQSICGTAASIRKPIIAADIQNSDYDKAALVRNLGMQAYACNPLIIGNRLLGTLSFASRRCVSFTNEQLEFLSIVSNFAAITMNRIYVLEKEREARHQAEAASRLKDDFLATVSHELRTPLNAIVGWSHLMKQNALTVTDLSNAIQAIYNSAINQAQIIDDLLDVARITSGKMTIQPEKISFQSILSAAISTISHAAEAKNIVVTTNFINSTQSIELYADPHRLQQAFWNLLSNSVKFTQEGGRIEITINATSSELEITIADNGKGISKEFLPFIFDRFRQAESGASRKYSGLGLGLAIAKDLIELHGGRISAKSDGESKGSTFTVWLPIGKMQQPDVNDAGRFAMSLRRPTNIYESNLSGFRILLVDDDANTLKVLNEAFLRSAADIRYAQSAVEAVAILNSWRPDLIISDIAMPDFDGFWLIKQVRSLNNGINQVPVIALTAYSSTNEREQVFKAGFNSMIPKPIEPSEVLKSA
ncbi:MAG TPA: ATP-binding protein, partial [Acidobacteriota bacterium]